MRILQLTSIPIQSNELFLSRLVLFKDSVGACNWQIQLELARTVTPPGQFTVAALETRPRPGPAGPAGNGSRSQCQTRDAVRLGSSIVPELLVTCPGPDLIIKFVNR
eukprot:767597-Hanusia_phi.AAC.6